MRTEYILAIVIIAVGLRFLFRGYAHKSKPRVLTGVGITLIGVSQFLRAHSFTAATIMAIGFMLFVASLYMLKMQHGQVMRRDNRRRR